MNIPSIIKIGAYDYKVVELKSVDIGGKEHWGCCDRENNVIMLHKGMKKTKEKEVFLHECLHAIEESYGIDLGESRVNLLALAIIALIKDNKLRF